MLFKKITASTNSLSHNYSSKAFHYLNNINYLVNSQQMKSHKEC